MEGQAFFTSVAGLAVSLAGFGSVIAWLREDPTRWDPISLWRVRTIVRHGLTLAFLCLALHPAFALTESSTATVRIGSLLLLGFAAFEVWGVRRPDPIVWPRAAWLVFVVTTSLIALMGAINVVLASVGLLQVGVLVLLTSPAAIFFNFVREMGGSGGTIVDAGPD